MFSISEYFVTKISAQGWFKRFLIWRRAEKKKATKTPYPPPAQLGWAGKGWGGAGKGSERGAGGVGWRTQFKYPLSLPISSRSRSCWVIWNLNLTVLPNLDFEDYWVFIKKQPSPSVKPTTQLGWGPPPFHGGPTTVAGSINSGVSTLGLGSGMIFGKA